MSYADFVIERSVFNGKGTLETNQDTMEEDRTTIAPAPEIEAWRTSLDRGLSGDTILISPLLLASYPLASALRL